MAIQKKMQKNRRPNQDYFSRFRPILAGFLSDWRNLILSLNMIYLAASWLLSGGALYNVAYFIVAVSIHIISIEFLWLMANRLNGDNSMTLLDGIFLSSYKGKDTNEHYKAMLTWIAFCQLLSLISIIFLLLWLVVPAKALWITWTKVISPQQSRLQNQEEVFLKKKGSPVKKANKIKNQEENKNKNTRKKNVS